MLPQSSQHTRIISDAQICGADLATVPEVKVNFKMIIFAYKLLIVNSVKCDLENYVSVYFEPKVILYLWNTTNYYTNQGK